MNTEDRTRELLDAAARTHDVDTERLWSRLEPELAAAERRRPGRSRPGLAVAAAAAVTAMVAGAAIWASNQGAPAPVPAVSSTGVVSTSPTPETSTTAPPATSAPTGTSSATSTPAPPATTSAPPVRPALSTESLLVAADYEAAGWVADDVQATKGWGQSPISACQYELPPAATQPSLPEPFRADGYPAAFGLGLAAYQYTFEFGSAATAEQVLQTVLTWPEGCGTRTGATVTSSAPWSHGRSDGSEGYWYTMSFEQSDGTRRAELVVVARAADRLSLIVLHEGGGTKVIDRVDASKLLNRQLERLG
ncbi:MAG TPA: hypothetical protein VFT81_02050 [Dermatophilaceae bacterium]|nr:hypothetical protein [Dermatophilaceae bacterium]